MKRPRGDNPETASGSQNGSSSVQLTLLCSSYTTRTTTSSTANASALGSDWLLDWLNGGHEHWWLREQRWLREGKWSA